jgi:hypothetical protein
VSCLTLSAERKIGKPVASITWEGCDLDDEAVGELLPQTTLHATLKASDVQNVTSASLEVPSVSSVNLTPSVLLPSQTPIWDIISLDSLPANMPSAEVSFFSSFRFFNWALTSVLKTGQTNRIILCYIEPMLWIR